MSKEKLEKNDGLREQNKYSLMTKKYVDNDNREERAIKKVKKSADVGKGRAIAILKNQGTLKQGKGGKLKIKKKRGK